MKVAIGFFLAMALVSLAATASGQASDTVRFLSAGSYDGKSARVRQTGPAASAWVRGTLRQLGTVVELDTATAVPMTVAHGQPVELEVMVGKRRARGALIGALAGVAVSVHALTTCGGGRQCAYCTYDGCDLLPLTTPIVVGVGAALGTLIGSGVTHWIKVK